MKEAKTSLAFVLCIISLVIIIVLLAACDKEDYTPAKYEMFEDNNERHSH